MILRVDAAAFVLAVAAVGLPVHGQSFGMAKARVTLQRKLPALMPVEGDSIRVRVTAHGDATSLAQDLQSQLLTELLKDDAKLHEEDANPSTMVNVEITDVGRIQRTVFQQPNLMAGKNGPSTIPYLRVTASLSVAFQAKTREGRTLGSDNITVNYDTTFDSSGNNASHGVMGTLNSSWHKIRGGSNVSVEDQPPTDAELRTTLLSRAVHQMASQIVNTSESVDVYLAKNKGAIDEGDKDAEAGLWERALETYETASPLSKREEDAYRLYDIGVANEALGYGASDPKSAMKFLDEAAINYGKAIDEKPSEKYFLEPQKRIETALMHYRKLEQEKNAPPPPPVMVAKEAAPPVKNTAAIAPRGVHHAASAPRSGVTHAGGTTHVAERALTNAQIIAMAKAGVAEDTIAQTVRSAKAVDFDLSSEARRRLEASGVSPTVVSAMKIRWAHELSSGN